MLLAAAIAVAIASATVAWFALRRGRRLRIELGEAKSRLAMYDAELPAASDLRGVSASALRRDQQKRFVAREAEHYHELLKRLLTDFRDATGAEEAVYWQFNPTGDALVPQECTSEGNTPLYFDYDGWSPHVLWAVEADAVQLIASGGDFRCSWAPCA